MAACSPRIRVNAEAGSVITCPYNGYVLVTPRTCTSRVLPVFVIAAIDGNCTTFAIVMPLRPSESISESAAADISARELSDASPPSSERLCSRTDFVRLSAKESIATSAATPSAMDDM